MTMEEETYTHLKLQVIDGCLEFITKVDDRIKYREWERGWGNFCLCMSEDMTKEDGSTVI